MRRRTPVYTRKTRALAEGNGRQLCRVLYIAICEAVTPTSVTADGIEMELIDNGVIPAVGDWVAYVKDSVDRVVCLGRLLP